MVRQNIKIILRIFLFLSIFCPPDIVFAQDGITDKELASQFLEIGDEIMKSTRAMDQALEAYVQAANFDPENVRANFMAGEFYLQTIDKDQASRYFLKVKQLNPNYRFDIDFKIGESYQFAMDLEKALEYYESYKKKLASRGSYTGSDIVAEDVVNKKITECENAREFRKNPINVKIENLGRTINSEFEDFAPVLNEDEDFLIFTTRRRDGNINENVDDDNKPYEDIFFSRKSGNSWGYAANIGRSVNTKTHDSNLALSPDGTTMFMYKTTNNGDIFVTTRQQDTIWTQPKPIGETINSNGFKESSVSISPDGNTIFFASNRPGGLGDLDIYYATKNSEGKWSTPRNLGNVINTPYNEDGPFIDYDGKTLYFSSMGHKGMGQYDIFKSVYDSASQKWSAPENLGFPINTPDRDIYFVTSKSGKYAYYASVREDGYGFTDIYRISFLDEKPKDPDPVVQKDPDPVVETTPQPVTVKVKVIDATTGQPMDATVNFKSIEGNTVAGMSKNGTGEYIFTTKLTNSDAYRLSVEAQGYVFETTDITVPAMTGEAKELNRTVRMRKPVTNVPKVLRNIYFDFNKATFQQSSYEELNRLHQMMMENADLTIEIAGHTDKVGSTAYNKDLSLKRANAVKNFLVGKGIDARRVETVGYGETKPLASNDDEKEGRELNRRVEFKKIN